MCFSNLAVEFDEHGDPYLAAEADEVDRAACDCAEGAVPLIEDPRGAYDELVQAVPDDVRDRLQDSPEAPPEGREARSD